jgi:hypothetical protein
LPASQRELLALIEIWSATPLVQFVDALEDVTAAQKHAARQVRVEHEARRGGEGTCHAERQPLLEGRVTGALGMSPGKIKETQESLR